jgi:hypothetical protein
MTTALPISNESMARAILRRTLREAPLEQREATQRAADRFAPSRHGRGPVFRAKVRFMDECLGNRVLSRAVTGKGKTALAEWVFWEILGDVPRPVICAAALDGRRLRLEESELVRVSQHALQRLFQRLRTEDPSAALLEVLPAAFHAAELYAKARAHQERYQVHLHVPTGEGEAVLVWEDDGFLVKTWLHQGSMSDARSARWGNALAEGDLLCA